MLVEKPGVKIMPATFDRREPEEDGYRQESVCTTCHQRYTAYTIAELARKELGHKCREIPETESA